MIRADYILSNWIYLWYILYLINGNSKCSSPKLLLILGLIHNLLSFIAISIYNKNPRIKYYYLILMFVGKILPLYTLSNITILDKDYLTSLYLVIFYICWLVLNNQNPLRFFTDSAKVIHSDKVILPMMKILDKYWTHFNI